MKKDLLQQAKTKKVETTMFEINDKGRELETRAGESYAIQFISFIESLGFAVRNKYDNFNCNIFINDREFEIEIDSASLYAKSSYTRKTKLRKPENRIVSLSSMTLEGTLSVRVQVNKELNADKLRTRIQSLIQANIDRELWIEERDTAHGRNAIAIGNHFCRNSWIKNNVDCIHIHNGELSFVTEYGSIIVNLKNNSTKMYINQKVLNTRKEIDVYQNNCLRAATALSHIYDHLTGVQLDDTLTAWIQIASHTYFYTKTMSTSKS